MPNKFFTTTKIFKGPIWEVILTRFHEGNEIYLLLFNQILQVPMFSQVRKTSAILEDPFHLKLSLD